MSEPAAAPAAPGKHRRYETTIIAAPNVTEDELNQIVAALEKVVADGGGTLIRTDRWGKRRLAFRVRKHEDGIYVLMFYEAPSAVVREIERRIRIEDRLIKFLTVLVDWEEKVARAEAARAARIRNAPPGRLDGGVPEGLDSGYDEDAIPGMRG